MRKVLFTLITTFLLGNLALNAQVTISGGTAAAGTYTTLTAAINALNAGGALTAPVVIDVNAGYTETLTGRINLTRSGDATNTITIQKSGSGANPVLTSYVGTNLAGTATFDGMFALVGADYVTIDGINLQEAAGNTTATTTMEYGYGLFKASATDGANNNVIRNCVITLNRVNTTAATNFPFNGSNGIILVPCTPTTMTTSITVTSSSGASSNNRFYSNTLQNLNTGISLCGFAGASPFDLCDTGNDVGGNASSTGNSIVNFGGGTAATNACAAVYVRDQWSFNISYNTVDNNVGGTGGINHPSTNRGIFTTASIGASATINNNIVTIRGGSSTSAIDWAIDCEMAQSGSGNTISINNNTISIEKTTSTTVALTAIWLQSAPTTANINGNTINNFLSTGTATADVAVIRSGLAPATLNINNNSISNVNFVGASGTGNIIIASGASATAVNINNNTISGININTASNTKTLNVINRNGAANTATVSMSNNIISNINRVGSGSTTLMTCTGTPLNQTIDGNQFVNLTIGSTGSVTFIAHSYTVPPGGSQIISNNQIVTGFNKTGAGGTVTCMTSGGSSISATTISHINNNWSNITVTGATTLNGISNTDGLSTITFSRTVTGNQFNNWTGGTSALTAMSYSYWGGSASIISNNTINNLTGAGAITGINVGSSGNAANPLTISNNTISNLTSSGTGGTVLGITTTNTSPGINIRSNTIHSLSSTAATVTGISSTGNATAVNVNQNKIYNLSSTNASAAVSGIGISNGATVNVFNNIVGDLRTPAANAANPLVGINVTGGATVNLHYNTVRLNATSSGALFGSSAVSVSSTPTATLRNNIFINASTANGTGLAVAYRRSSTTLTTYGSASDRNMYFAPTLFTDGTNSYATLAVFRAAMVNRDQNSFFENPTFLNTTAGANAGFLHLDPSVGTQAESGGIAISGVDTDFDGDIRQGSAGYVGVGQAPDLGADEGDFTLTDLTSPVISFLAPSNNACSASSRNFTATITDASGVPSTGALMPRIYYRKNAGTYFSAPGALASGTPKNGVWSFTIDYSTVGGIATGDLIEYYVIAQDIAATPNLMSSPAGAIATDVNNVTAAPTALTYNQSTFLSGTYTVGASGNYSTLSAAVNAYNTSCLAGPVVFQLLDASYNESVSILNNIDASSINTLTIYPVNSGTVVSGNTANPTIDLNGARFINIDGRPGGTGVFASGSSMVINNTLGTASAVRFVNDANNNVFRYCDIQSNNSNTAATSAGVVFFGSTTGQNGNDNNTITYCDVHNITGGNPVVAINSNGSSITTQSNDNNTVSFCNINDYFHATNASTGILIQTGNSAWNITNNKFYQTAARTITGTGFNRDIFINNLTGTSAGSGFVISGNNFGGDNPSGSGMYTLTGTSAHQYCSIFCAVGVGTPTSIQNNTFNNISFTSGSTSASAMSCITNNGGNVDIGTVTGNVVGLANTDASVSPAISYTNNSTTTGGFIPIFAQCTNNAALSTTNISNNIISGVVVASTTATNAPDFNAIGYNNGNVSITNNTIGSGSTPKSIYCSSTSATSNTNTSRFSGILISGGATSSKNVTVTGNTIANMWTNYANPGAPATTGARGIFVVGTLTGNLSTVISNNTIRDITTFAATTTGNPFCAAGGITVSAASMASCDVLNNTIYNINSASPATTGAVQVTGIFYGATTTNPGNVNNNNIHSLGLSGNNPSAFVTGMDIGSGNLTIANNMIRIGIDGTGADITAPCTVRGITKNAATSRIYHNSIYVGGQNVGTSTTNTFALVRTGTAVDDWRNNILVNNRSNASTGGKHYAINLTATTTLTLNYNDYFGNGTGYVFGSTGTDVLTYSSGWVAGDNNSYNIDPIFINPTGDASNVNLHLNSTIATIAEGTGTPIATVTTDFDGETRSGLTPTDLGADAGDFVSLYCNGIPPSPTAVISGNASIICISGTKNLSLTGYSATPGITLQWKQSTVSGGPYTNVTGGTGATTSGYTTATLVAPTYFVCELTCANGGSTALSSEVLVDVNNPTVVSTTPGGRCGAGTVDLQAVASNNATLNWYESATGGSTIGTGSTFTTPSITATKTYYVAAAVGATTSVVGRPALPLTNACGAATATTATDWPIRFNTTAPVTIASVTVVPNAAGAFALRWSASLSTTALFTYSTTFTAAQVGTAVVLPINLSIPNPGTWQLTNTTGGGYRVGTHTAACYPMNSALGGLSIVGSATTSTSATSQTQYNMFFDFVVQEGCESARTAVTATITAPPVLAITSNQLLCTNQTGTISVTTGSTDFDNFTWSPSAGLYFDNALTQPYNGNPTSATTLFLNSATAGSTKYTCDAVKVATGCVNSASSYVTFGLSGTATVASQVNSCAGTGLIATNVSGAGTIINEDFNSGLLPSNMTSAGNSFAITGGRMQLTTSATSRNGGVLIENPTGLANNDFQIDFDMITTAGSGSPADGFSYSYGDDVVALPTGTGSTTVNTTVPSNTTNAENGSGTKLKLAFDAYTNGANAAGVYLMYNSPIWNQSSTNTSAQGLIAYVNNTAWRATSTTGKSTHVTITIDALGQISLFLDGIAVVTNQQLPASYLTDDKSTWKHAFCARTGAEFQGHFIDNLQIRYNNYYEYSINGTTWTATTPIAAAPGTYNVSARYVSTPTCVAPLGSVTIDPVSAAITSKRDTVCYGKDVVLSATPTGFVGANYVWESSPAGLNSFTPTGGSTSTVTVTLTAATDFRCVIDCGGGTSFTSNTKTVYVDDPQVVSTTPGSRCGTGTVDLAATATSGATINWYETATGGARLATGNTFTTPILTATKDYYVSAVSGGNAPTTIPGDGGWNHVATGGAFQTTLIGSAYMILTALQPFTLSSLDIYPSAALGTAFTVEARTGSATGATYLNSAFTTTVVNTGTPSVAQTLTLNWQLAPGTYYIGFPTTNPGCWRTSATHSFPWVLPGVASLDYYLTPSYQYYFYNLIIGSGCESARQIVSATITPPPAINVSPDVTTCSAGPAQNLTVTSTNAGYTYSWDPATGLSSSTGQTVSALPPATTRYNVTASDASSGCITTGTVKVTVNPTPDNPIVNTTVNATPCSILTQLEGTNSSQSATATMGTGTTLNTTTSWPCPLGNFYKGQRHQFIYTKAELDAIGMNTGSLLNGVSMLVTTQNTSTALIDYTVKIGHTSKSVFTSTIGQWVDPATMTTVFNSPALAQPATGATLNLPFTVPFAWNGTDNIVIEFANCNGSASTYTTNPLMAYSTLSAAQALYVFSDGTPGATVNDFYAFTASSTPTATTNRTNIIFDYTKPANYVWTPATGLFTDASASIPYVAGAPAQKVWAKPNVPTTYTVSATTPVGCSAQATATGSAAANARFVELTGLGSSIVTASSSCEDGGWTNYHINGKIFFAINWAPNGTLSTTNAAAKNAVSVRANLDPTISQCESAVGNKIYAMKRWWNVTTPPFTDPVSVRFYHDPSEVADVITAAGGAAPAFNWFKNNTGPYNQATMVLGKNGIASGATTNLTGVTGTDQGVTYVQFDGITSFSGGTGAARTLEQALRVSPKVYLNNYETSTGLMNDYMKTIVNFPLSDPYSTLPLNLSFTHVNSGPPATISPAVLTTNGNNSIVDWMFMELRQGPPGSTSVVQTKAALIQRDGDVVDVDGVSPVSFFGVPSSNYITMRHRSHLGFRTDGTYPLTATPTVLNFTNNSVSLNGAYPQSPITANISAMNSGDANSDGSVDSIDSIDWETQNGLFDDYLLNADYNMDGSVDSIDSIVWETNNGTYQELD